MTDSVQVYRRASGRIRRGCTCVLRVKPFLSLSLSQSSHCDQTSRTQSQREYFRGHVQKTCRLSTDRFMYIYNCILTHIEKYICILLLYIPFGTERDLTDTDAADTMTNDSFAYLYTI